MEESAAATALVIEGAIQQLPFVQIITRALKQSRCLAANHRHTPFAIRRAPQIARAGIVCLALNNNRVAHVLRPRS